MYIKIKTNATGYVGKQNRITSKNVFQHINSFWNFDKPFLTNTESFSNGSVTIQKVMSLLEMKRSLLICLKISIYPM